MNSPRPSVGLPIHIAARLASLFGEAGAADLGEAPEGRLARDRVATGISPSTSTLSERDAWLITYADQVRASGVAPLQTLATFAGDTSPGSSAAFTCCRSIRGLQTTGLR